MTVMLDEYRSSTRLEEASRIPLISGGTLASSATLSARGINFVGSSGNLHTGGMKAEWLGESFSDLRRWLNEKEDWDSYGARPISPNVGRRVLKFLTKLAEGNTPKPFLTGTPSGGINLQWEDENYDIQFSFEDCDDGEAMYWNKEEDVYWEGSIREAIPAVNALMARTASAA